MQHYSIQEIRDQFITILEMKKNNNYDTKTDYVLKEKIKSINRVFRKKTHTDIDEINLNNDFRMLQVIIKNGVIVENVSVFSNSGNQLENFVEFADELEDKEYWKELASAYQLQDYSEINFELYKVLFSAKRGFKEYLMSKEDREFLIALPEILTIYRGCSGKEIKHNLYGISWTLNKEIASQFADRKKILAGKSSVVERTIKKSEVIAYFNSREEEEIIYFI